ncbi:uncharacterized protein LOC113494375 [Trichoplusia ni]|uniref:Uncharacterized protein LOC113494375 n=1 Tax=Trichoplusia ni TaxID=7111 RepID=A0A7E5VJL7_TRINI|nr:uncharacterized protein LOC113494375 [Trichoplusia ni]
MPICGACGSMIVDRCFMECSNGRCKKSYDIACLEVDVEVFKSYTEEYKLTWVCPECICLMPKRGNVDTPIVVRTPASKGTTSIPPIDNINMKRGSQACCSPTMDADSMLLEELREFRAEIMVRMDSQAETINVLLNQFSQTRSDLDSIMKLMRVLEEKVATKQTRDISNETVQNPPSTFAEITSQQKNSNTKKKQKISKTTTTTTHKDNKGGATKAAVLPITESAVITALPTSTPHEQTDVEEGDTGMGWTTVTKKKNNRPPKSVAVGTNKELKAIQATERKKHLHVWRLHPETTIEAITDHVNSVCGPDVHIKVDKIVHKTKRDYASFKIEVPENCFQKLNRPEIWPINTEFNEWIWFRNSTKTGTN